MKAWFYFLLSPLALPSLCDAWTTGQPLRGAVTSKLLARRDDYSEVTRRDTFTKLSGLALSAIVLPVSAEEGETLYEQKFIQQYEDFNKLPSGVSYRDVNLGKGPEASKGDRVVYDWSGYTIGYFGRPFQAKGGPQVRQLVCSLTYLCLIVLLSHPTIQGGAFDKDLDYERTVLGSHQIVPGLEEAFYGMQAGGVRQVVVPYKVSYPADDLKHEKVGPKPSTFSGMRALNFVLENPRLDRTLLFNVKVVRIDKPNGSGGFTRG